MGNEVIQVVTQPSWVEIAMFAVTTLYLFATIGVFLANRKMAKAAEDQIKIAMKMSELSRNLDLMDKRIALIANYEIEGTFNEHNPLLDVLFPDYIQQLEKSIVTLKKKRQGLLEQLLYLSITHNAYHNNAQEFTIVNKAMASIEDIEKYTSVINEAAKKGIHNPDRRLISIEDAEALSIETISITVQMESIIYKFFIEARSFIEFTIRA